jgi:predicted enzyme related to lactoylglutathione lyase
MREDGKLDYLEMPGGDLPKVKAFYAQAFGWAFTDYGPLYAAFSEGLDGGFNAHPGDAAPKPLPVLYATDLDALFERVKAAGATIARPIFDFPGGRRFHFLDPAGNEMAAWSEPKG